jgi:hypothetical protein
VVDPGRGAKQDHSILCVELGRRLCHSLLRSSALGERDRGTAAHSEAKGHDSV